MLYPTLIGKRSGSLWDDMLSLRRNFDHMLADYFEDSGPGYGMGGWMPQIDVMDRSDAVQVTADLPGFRSDDIDVSVQNGVLTISGERREAENDGASDFRIRERRFGRFERNFTLPSGVDADAITADYENGVLTISLPKAESAKPRRVKIEEKKNWRERITAGKSS